MGDTKILNIAEHSRAQSIQSTRAEPQGTKEHSSEHRRKHGREHGREQNRKSRAERAEQKEQLTRHWPKALWTALLLQETRPQPASREPRPPLLSAGSCRDAPWTAELILCSRSCSTFCTICTFPFLRTFRGRYFSIAFAVGSELGAPDGNTISTTRWLA